MGSIIETRNHVRSTLKMKNGFISKSALQRSMGITDTEDESQRKEVWNLSAALAQLWKEKVIGCEPEYVLGTDNRLRISGMLYYSREVV